MAMRGGRLRILFHAQHLSGVGHFMRSLAIARHMAGHHDVWLTQGGIPVPYAHGGRVRLLPLPGLRRSGSMLVPVDYDADPAGVWHERRRRIAQTIDEIRPDIVIVEHYPFSKWELGDEIEFLLDRARERNPDVKRVCSVRDVPLQTRHEQCTPAAYIDTVLSRLHGQFDALMVHADENLCRLDDAFGAVGSIRIPICHTGVVCQSPEAGLELPGDGSAPLSVKGPFAIASIGGGNDMAALLARLAAHWRDIRQRAGIVDWKLVMFGGLNSAGTALEEAVRRDESILLRPFSPDYLSWLECAGLSISCAGYNTCANLMRTATPALLVPNTGMSDQVRRARLMHARGLAEMLMPDDFNAGNAAAAIRRLLNGGQAARMEVNLKGTQGSRLFLEGLAGIVNGTPGDAAVIECASRPTGKTPVA
jgi:predicted glycosyltransferase